MFGRSFAKQIIPAICGLQLLAVAIAGAGNDGSSAWRYRFEPFTGITTSGQPTAAGLEELANEHYAAVIDLRTEAEDRGLDEEHTVRGLGMDYVSLPIAGRDDVNFDNAARLDEILSRYDQPVLVHCGSGNRAGALLALRHKLNGANDEESLALGKAAGMTSLEETVKERLAGGHSRTPGQKLPER